VQAWRDREVGKLLDRRKTTYETAIKDIDESVSAIKSIFDPAPVDDASNLARRLRLADQWSMYPSNKLKAVDLKTLSSDDLVVYAATCRKRSLQTEADAAYVMHDNLKNGWKTSPQVRELEQLKAKLITLHLDDKNSFWVGSSLDTIDKSDFGEILEGGAIRFRDGDEVITV